MSAVLRSDIYINFFEYNYKYFFMMSGYVSLANFVGFVRIQGIQETAMIRDDRGIVPLFIPVF